MPVAVCTVLALVAVVCLAADGQYVFEELGEPVCLRSLSIQCMTKAPDGGAIAWAAYEGTDRHALLGVRTDTGELIWVDVSEYGRTHIQMTRGLDGNLYAYTGRPAHFLRYEMASGQLVDLGVPAEPGYYFLGSAVGPDGKFYVGSYPATHLVCCDTATGEIEGLGRIAEDKRECYIIHPVVSDDNVVYCPVGLHHMELWAYDVQTRTKRQILPEELTEAQGCPKAWVGTDGQVYGSASGKTFLCKPDAIEFGEAPPAREDHTARTLGPLIAWGIDEEGRLKLRDTETGEDGLVQTPYQGDVARIFSVGCERDGKIYGATISPAYSFCYDTAAGELTDLGRISSGRIQVYDTISLPQGLFLSSYTGAHVDFYDPDQPREAGVNPRHIGRPDGQERPIQWCLGPDGMLYTGTVPVKGRLGGALVRVDPEELALKAWPSIIPNQSIMYVEAVAETGELFCTTSVRGGSSAIPTETEACVFLWDTNSEQVTFTAHPIPEARHYGRAVRARTGLIYGLCGDGYYAFDPIRREAVFTGELPAKGSRFPGLSDEPVGPRGLIYGLAGDAVFAIDPADHTASVIARHKSIEQAHGFLVTQDGVLYYGSGPTLMRCRLQP